MKQITKLQLHKWRQKTSYERQEKLNMETTDINTSRIQGRHNYGAKGHKFL